MDPQVAKAMDIAQQASCEAIFQGKESKSRAEVRQEVHQYILNLVFKSSATKAPSSNHAKDEKVDSGNSMGRGGKIIPPESCPECHKENNENMVWYRYDKQTICKGCYQKFSRRKKMYLSGEEAGVTDRECSRAECGRRKSGAWYVDKVTGMHICSACYMFEYTSKTMKQNDRVCNNCQSDSTRQWYKDKVTNQGYICTACYKKRIYVKK